MKLEVGMYVRTKGGFIDKIISFKSTISNDYVELEDEYYANKKDILKASYNIGKLLEAGDFLDYHCIAKIEGTTIFLKDGWYIDFDDVEDLVDTICTREQFESISYKVGE